MSSVRNPEQNPDYIMQTLRLQVGHVFVGERHGIFLPPYTYILSRILTDVNTNMDLNALFLWS